jgi:hypothetical protein
MPKDDENMRPVRAFLASLSLSLLALTLSYQASAIPAALTPPMPSPKSDAWMDHASSVKDKKGARDDMSEFAPLLSAS